MIIFIDQLQNFKCKLLPVLVDVPQLDDAVGQADNGRGLGEVGDCTVVVGGYGYVILVKRTICFVKFQQKADTRVLLELAIEKNTRKSRIQP
jgi:hypothetical protein